MSEEDKKRFGSFADLAKSMGVEPDDSPDAFDPDDPVAAWDAQLGGLRDNTREVIASAGEAFGPMEHGPACYRDPASEEMELLASFRIRTVFPDAVKAEVGSLPEDPSPADFEGREDLRGQRIFTVDGEDAKDYDDAIQVNQLDDDRIEVGVHIADVSHYVVPGTALDKEALTRGTSVYVPDQVVPMLPEELSNHLCSLVPDRDRLAFSVYMVFDRHGERESCRVHKSVIRSMFRCTYKVVQELLDGVDNQETRRLKPIAEDLRLFEKWTRQQQLIRDRKGSLRMQSAERKFAFDDKHEVERIYPSDIYFSQTLIEETALAANQAVGDYFKKRDLPTIYRIHPKKDQDGDARQVRRAGASEGASHRPRCRPFDSRVPPPAERRSTDRSGHGPRRARRVRGGPGRGHRRALGVGARALPALHLADPPLSGSHRPSLATRCGGARERGGARRNVR